MNEELRETAARLERIRNATSVVEETAIALKAVADQLRADVEELTERVAIIENRNQSVAEDLEVAKEVVQEHQAVQDNRLDTLENGN